MIKSHVGHIQFNVNPQNLGFYKDLLSFLGWAVLYEDPTMLGFGDERGESLWFATAQEISNDYDGPGMNHLGIGVDAQAEVDNVVTYLQQHQIEALFETPRHRPEFSSDPDRTYYQVMFESPDHILFEVVYTGPAAVK